MKAFDGLGGAGKNMLFIFGHFENGNLPQKLTWPTIHNSAEFRERVHIRFKNVGHVMWELFSTTCWSFLVCELQGLVYTMPMNFIDTRQFPAGKSQEWAVRFAL